MNKYFQIFVISLFVLASGYAYQEFYRPKDVGGVSSTGNTIVFEMRVLKNQWKWDPSEIHVKAGDKVRLEIFNEDEYDHGFAIDTLGVNRRLFPERTTVVEFNASVPGKFAFSCSVQCGAGHYDQVGLLFVER